MDYKNSVRIPDVISINSEIFMLSNKAKNVEDQTSSCNMATVLAKDIVAYKTVKPLPSPPNKHALTLRRTVDEVSERHPIVFGSIVKKLGPLDEDSLPGVFVNVANEMLRDGALNWGRVVSLFAFAASLAAHFKENKQQHLINIVTQLLADYVTHKINPWVAKQGGWDAFDRYFPEPNGVESTIWKGLLYTFMGLGALASMAAAR
jgi:hypothetical protein